MSKLLQKQEAKTWPFFFKVSRYSRTRNNKIISRVTPMVFLAQVCLLPRQTQETCLVFSPSPLKGGISYIPWCTASYNIIKLSNAHDPILSCTWSYQFNRDVTVEQQWKATCSADETSCTFAFTIFVLLFQIYLSLSQRGCFGRRYWLTCRPIAKQFTQMLRKASEEDVCFNTSCFDVCW